MRRRAPAFGYLIVRPLLWGRHNAQMTAFHKATGSNGSRPCGNVAGTERASLCGLRGIRWDANGLTDCRLRRTDVCRSDLCLQEGNEHLRAEDLQHPLQVVGQDMQAHFRSDPRQGFGEEVGRPHPCLQRPERVFNRLSPYA